MKKTLSGERMYVKDLSICLSCKQAMQAVRKRSTKDHMVPSEVIASRAYNDVVSTHIMLLTGHYLPERF